MSTHTPGPWTVTLDGGSRFLEGENGETLAELLGGGVADRALIASAPDLLAACESTLSAMEDAADIRMATTGGTWTNHEARAVDALRAAIQKARGES